MSVTQVGTPTVSNAVGTSLTPSWNGTQTRTAGNLLVAICAAESTGGSMSYPTTATGGWTLLLSVGNTTSGAGTCQAALAIYTKTAAGTDAAPAFTATNATDINGCMYVLTGGNTTTPADTSGTYASGSTSSTLTMTATTTGNVTAAGEFAISAWAMERAALTDTWTPASGWTNGATQGSAQVGYFTSDFKTSAPSSGSALTEAPSWSTATAAFGCGAIVVFALAASIVYVPPQGCQYGTSQRARVRRTRAVIGNNQSNGNAVHYVLQAPAVGHSFISQRRAVQRTRAITGNSQSCADGVAGPAQRAAPKTAPTFVAYPRKPTQRSRAHIGPYGGVSGSVYGFLQPHGPPRQIPSSAVPLRRKSVRAVIAHHAGTVQAQPFTQPRATVPVPRRVRTRAGLWSKTYAGGTALLPTPSGKVQPAAHLIYRRNYARAVIKGVTPPNPVPVLHNGTVQLRATVPVPRRLRVRGLFRINAVPPIIRTTGSIQSRATIPVPRRVRVRGFWRWNGGTRPRNSGIVQPAATRQPRRTRARAVTSWSAPFPGHLTGRVQSRATVPVPRRYRARSGLFRIGHGFPQGIPGLDPQQANEHQQPRRARARAVVRTIQIPARLQLGRTPPRPITIADPRRAVSRGKWQGIAGKRPLIGKTEPRDVTMQPRRTSSRAAWHRIIAALPPRGVTPPAAVALVHRRTAERGTWHGQKGIRALAGQPAPRGDVAQPRRARTRITWNRTAGALPAVGVSQPRPTVPLPRRVPARSRWARTTGVLPRPGEVQPQPTRQPRRESTRAAWCRLVTFASPPRGTVQPEQAQPHRRGTARAVIRRQQSVFVVESTVEIAFNIYTAIESSVEIAFNIGAGRQTGERLMPEVPFTSSFDARRKLVEDQKNPTQGEA